VTKFSPAELFLGYNPVPWWEENDDIVQGRATLPEKSARISQSTKDRQKMYEMALKSIQDYKKKQQEKYNKIHKEVLFKPGQLVWIRSLGVKSNKAKKISAGLFAPWKGIYRIKEAFSKTQYQVETLDGKDAGRHHVVNLKSVCLPPGLTHEELRASRWAGGTEEEQVDDEKDEEEDDTPRHRYVLRSHARPIISS
jgi:hypothetical protein